MSLRADHLYLYAGHTPLYVRQASLYARHIPLYVRQTSLYACHEQLYARRAIERPGCTRITTAKFFCTVRDAHFSEIGVQVFQKGRK